MRIETRRDGEERPRHDAASSVTVVRRLRRQAFLLEYLTVVWNVFEGVAAILVGLAAGSVALVGFGLDSMVEVVASLVVVWELRRRAGTRASGPASDRRRPTSWWRRISYGTLFKSLVAGNHPSASPLGVGLTSTTVVAMFALSAGKRWVGARLGSSTVLADARFSLIDGFLAASVLAGLTLNLIAGWWWADPGFALVLAVAAGREGIESLKHEEPKR